MVSRIFKCLVILLVFCACFCVVSTCFADKHDKEGKTGTDRLMDGNYKLIIGGTRSFPKLSRANRDVHAVEAQLREFGPDVEDFEDWGDVWTGTVGGGLQKKVELKDIIFWLGIYGYYSQGPIETRQRVDSIFAVPMVYDFEQKYQLIGIEAELWMEVFRYKRLTGIVGGDASYNWFKADTELELEFEGLGTNRSVDANFKDEDAGFGITVALEFDITKHFGLNIAGRYDWIKFTGDNHVSDITNSPLGTTTSIYDQRSTVDLTGPSIGIYFISRFW